MKKFLKALMIISCLALVAALASCTGFFPTVEPTTTDPTHEHKWTDATCTTPKTCKVCGATEGEALGHTANEDDGSCLTAVTCQRCPEVMTPARTEHEANEDDGDCTTAVTCKHCTTVMTEAKTNHEANDDDGDCTTAVTCKHCTTVMTEAKEHDFTGEWQFAAEGHYHICENDGCTVTDTMIEHTVDESGNCSICGCTSGLEYTELTNDDGAVIGYAVSLGNATATNIVIPNYYNGLPVTSIGNYAFDGCTSLESITIPDSVTSIGDYAFNSFAAEASVIINGVKTYYSTFDNAIAFANGKDDITIVIESNCIYNGTEFEGGNITIDLNGKTIEGSPNYSNLNMVMNGACVTIRDTVGGGAMLLMKVGVGTSGTLIIESGTYNYAYAPQYLKITGGEFDCVTITTGDEATISGGSFAKIGIYSGVGTLDDLLADGYCFYDADGNEVDTSSVELNGYWYYLYNVTVGHVDNTEGRE